MKNITKTKTIFCIAVLLTAVIYSSCGGGGLIKFADTEPEPFPFVTATLSPVNGASDVAVDVTVSAVFSGMITQPVDWSNLFTVKLDGEGNSLCTSVTYDSGTLTATCAHADFANSSSYTAAVNGITDMFGSEVAAVSATFSTVSSVAPPVTSVVTLLRLDGTELQLTDRPIPRSARIKYTLDAALPEPSQRDAFESSVTVTDENGSEVPGAYAWAADYMSTVFTPSSKLGYAEEYTITIDSSTMPMPGLSKAIEDVMAFTTMTKDDVNGDGYADVISGNFSEESFLFYGSADGIANCDMSGGCDADAFFTEPIPIDSFGQFSNIVGDVNADGYADLIFGADNFDIERGAAFIFLGSPTLPATCDLTAGCTPDTTLLGGSMGDGLGFSPGPAGDVNGDGFDDVLVGASEYPGADSKGRAYVFYGSVNGIPDCDISAGCTPQTAITGESDFDFLCWPGITTAGDVNGDGYDDILIPGQYWFAGSRGQVHLFLGSADGIANCDMGAGCTPDATFIGENNGDSLGAFLSDVGDINADGYDDIVISASGYPSGANVGRSYIFYGSAESISSCDLSGTCTADNTITGYDAPGALGWGTGAAGDINDDGYADMVLGAYLMPGMEWGWAFVFLGSASGISDCDLEGGCVPDTTIKGYDSVGWFGRQVLGRDVNGDGYFDLVINALRTPDGDAKGQVYIFHGSDGGISDCDLSTGCIPDTILTGSSNGDWFGWIQ